MRRKEVTKGMKEEAATCTNDVVSLPDVMQGRGARYEDRILPLQDDMLPPIREGNCSAKSTLVFSPHS